MSRVLLVLAGVAALASVAELTDRRAERYRDTFVAYAATPGDQAGIDATIRETMAQTGVEGLAIAVVRNGRVAWSRGYGSADVETGAAVTPQTTFQAASLGKVAAAYAVMVLVEKGVLALDAPLRSPRLKVADGCTPPTIAHALSHTTGLGNNLQVKSLVPDCAPGKTFSYSGEGFALIAEMIEAATGKKAIDAIDEAVFAPLQMRSTRFGPPLGEFRASGHTSLLSSLVGEIVFHSPIWFAIGVVVALLLAIVLPAIVVGRGRGWLAGIAAFLLTGVVVGAAAYGALQVRAKAQADLAPDLIAASLTSSAEDMAKLLAEMLTPTLISQETRDAMFTPQTQNSGCIQWGLGIGIDTCTKRVTYWQWGSNLGFQGLLVLDPERGDGVVILTNTGGGLEAALPDRGGYAASKAIVRKVLAVDGLWDIWAEATRR